jgi:inositol hexakisphosphate/diphosphoinositol-pentakisphosphate kinase
MRRKEVGNPRKTLLAIHSTIGKLVEQLDDMLGELVSGDEEVIEGGAGLKSKEEHDEALSGIKLYKGETLLELTERWKLLQNKLYDEEKDLFDLSRVPDVHDNVRFDMLHNPHLGLTSTLSTLYDLAKSMADCVVPQEYGITLEEKRDIGCKMCGTLLEKINFDLAIARTDNQVDMRYLINMDYSSDLPINSMGRRVRSRLYFTSESHLHSLLNVLRIHSFKEGCVKSPLSIQGQKILSDASELCYLTQVVMRLFEDTQKPIEDPKRFRVEIWFSPGATATPLHMETMYRENDSSRFDTEKLQKISIEGLSCTQVEAYFAEAIKDGKPALDDNAEDLLKVKEEKEKSKDKDKGKKEKDKATSIEEPTDKKDAAAPNGEKNDAEATISTTHSKENGHTSVKEEKSVLDEVSSESISEQHSKTGDIESTNTTRSSVVYLGVALGATAIALLLSRGRGKR